MKRFKDYTQNQVMLLPPSLDELVGEEDLVRMVDRVMEKLDLRAIYARFEGGGSPSYHPLMMLKILVYAYCTKLYSSRQIAKALRRDVGFMWLSGMQKPDFHTVNRFRSEYFKDTLEKVFAEVVLLLLEHGYIRSEDYFVDGTKLEADAGKYTHVWRRNVKRYKGRVIERARKIIEDVEEINRKEDIEYGGRDLPEFGGETPITSSDISDAAEAINERLKKNQTKPLKKAAKELTELASRLERYEQQEETLGERNSYSKTDNEATFMRLKNDETRAAYNLQIGTENGFVVGFSVHQNASDNATLNEHLRRRERHALPMPDRIIADAAYGTEQNYHDLAKRGIDSYLKYPDYRHEVIGNVPTFDRRQFTYDEKEDCFSCPVGRELPFLKCRTDKSRGGFISRLKVYECRSCKACRFRSQCCKGKGDRQIAVNKRLERYKATARKNLLSELGASLRKRRRNEVESIFGHLKANQNYRRFRLRGLLKARLESAWLFISINVQKLLANPQPLLAAA